MNTISLNRTTNATFKQVQRLPALTPAMIERAASSASFRPTPPPRPARALAETRAAVSPAFADQLPSPRASQGTGAQVLFALLALSAAGCAGQALAAMDGWLANWPQFPAWVAQLLG